MNWSQNPIDRIDLDFAAAAKNWYLDRLYIDLATAKGRALTPLEKKFLKGLLCGCSPAEIALKVYRKPNSSAVRVYLSSGLYKYIRELFFTQKGEKIRLRNWSHVTNWLEKAGYKKQRVDRSEAIAPPAGETGKIQEYTDLRGFCGREEELAQLQRWIASDRVRLVALLGLGGVGKTLLAAQLCQYTQGEFERVIWRSLGDVASLTALLADLIPENVKVPRTTHAQISLLIEQLRSQRCLLIFDSAEAIAQRGQRAGLYQDNFAAFGELLKRLSAENHQSCCLLISREKPRELFFLEEEPSCCRSLAVKGLQLQAALKLPEIQALTGLEAQKQALVRRYASNPLFLKMATRTINELFNSNLTEFLAVRTAIFGEIRDRLDRQFERLWEPERRVLYNLSLSQCLGELRGFAHDIPLEISSREQLEALESLQRRLLIQKSATGFRPIPLLHTHVLEKIIEQICTQTRDRDMVSSIELILRESLLGHSFLDSPFNLAKDKAIALGYQGAILGRKPQ